MTKNQSGFPEWTEALLVEADGEGEPRDPLRAQVTLDQAADGLFRSGKLGLTSLTDHLGYLALHGWLKDATERFFELDLGAVFCCLVLANSLMMVYYVTSVVLNAGVMNNI